MQLILSSTHSHIIESSMPTKHLSFQCQHLFGTFFALIFRSGADFAVFRCYVGQICIKLSANLASKFRTNLVGNIKKQYIQHCLNANNVQINWIFWLRLCPLFTLCPEIIEQNLGQGLRAINDKRFLDSNASQILGIQFMLG